MITNNIDTDLDIANGARGEIIDIKLDPKEPPLGTAPVVRLEHLPVTVLVKLHRTRAGRLTGLEENVVLVEAIPSTMNIKIRLKNSQTTSRTVTRHQIPMTGAYALTDYRAQGQTMTAAIADIAMPPSGTLTLFNLYVALSRSSGQESIRLLRDFNEDIFMQPHNPALTQEDERLETLHETTKRWWETMKTDAGYEAALLNHRLSLNLAARNREDEDNLHQRVE
jgi:hypothetical protein